MKERGIDNKTLAEKLGKKSSYISSVCSAGRAMSLNALSLIAEGLGVEFAELFETTHTKASPADKGVKELQKLLMAELAFPDDFSERHFARMLDSLHECLPASDFKAFVDGMRNRHGVDAMMEKAIPLVGEITLSDM